MLIQCLVPVEDFLCFLYSQIGLPVFSGYFGNHEGPYVLQQFDCTDDLKSCQEAFWMTGEACDSIAVDCSSKAFLQGFSTPDIRGYKNYLGIIFQYFSMKTYVVTTH